MARIVLEIRTGEGSDWVLETLENVADYLANVLYEDHAVCHSGPNPPILNILEREE